MSPFSFDITGVKVGVVIPCYRVADQIERVLRGIPDFVHSIIVVEDDGRDDTAARVRAFADDRITLLTHSVNQGVGAAMRTGFAEALRRNLDIVVKMDGDDQMDPAALPRLLAPLLRGQADMSKGNRYHNLVALRQMPPVRMVGNALLTFLVKLASGYWRMFDPTNGYLAIRTDVLRRLRLEKLPSRFFFESGLLIQLGILGAVVQDVPISARYGQGASSLSVGRTTLEFPPRLGWGLIRRLFWRYIVYDFSAVSVFLLLSIPLLVWGLWFGIGAWRRSVETGTPATAGTVMLAAMPIIMGFQLLLEAVVVDIGNVPRIPLSPPLKAEERRVPDRA
ncbi:MAG: glycosyltransferase family 2 protein [Planctomycetota bacterium]